MRALVHAGLVALTISEPAWSCPVPPPCLGVGCTRDGLARADVIAVVKVDEVDRPFSLMRSAREWAFVLTGFRSLLPETIGLLRIAVAEVKPVKGELSPGERLALRIESGPVCEGPSVPQKDHWYLISGERSGWWTTITGLDEIWPQDAPDDVVRSMRDDLSISSD